MEKYSIWPLFLSIIIVLLLSCNIVQSYSKNEKSNSISQVTAVTGQSDKEEILITALENKKTKEERKKTLEENKEIITPSLVIVLLNKAHASVDNMTLSTRKSQDMGKIALEVAEFTGDKISMAKALKYNASFEVLEKKDTYPPSLQKALELFIEAGDRKGEACCYYQQAKIFYFTSNETEKASAFLDKSMKIFEETGDDLSIGDCYQLKGQVYKSLGDKDRAIDNVKKAIKLYEKKGDTINILFSYQEMIYICISRGFLEEAEHYLEIKKKLIDELKPEELLDYSGKDEAYRFRDSEFKSKEKLLVDYYMTLGQLYSIMGKYEESIRSNKKAIETGSKMDMRSFSEMYALWNLGGLYGSLGQKDMALKYYLEAVNKKNRDDEINLIAANYMLLGHFYLKDMNEPDEAMKYYEIALKESEKIEMNVFRDQYKALCIRFIGQVFMEKGDFERAIEKLQESMKIFEELHKDFGHNETYLVWNYDLLGKAYQKKCDNKKALLYMNKAIKLAKESHIQGNICSAYKYMGDFYFDRENFSMALGNYLEALKVAEEIRSSHLLWEYYFTAGKTYEKLGNLKEAYNAYDNSIKIIENMRQEFKIEELKRDFMQDKIKVYEHMIDILIKLKKEEEAFNCNERCRSRAFLDILANQKVDIRHGVNPALVQKEEELTNRIQFLSSDIRQEKGKPVISQRSAFIEERDSTLKKLKIEYRQVMEEIKMENPEYMSLITINPCTLEEIKSFLDKDTVIVEYFLGENISYCWIAGNNSFNTVIINHKEHDIENLVKKYRDVACDNMTPEKLKSNEWKEISEKLYTILFKDVEKYMINKKRILISPHKILHYLPFQVLSDHKGTMLVEKYDISYLPSASVLKYCQKKNTLKKEKLLAFDLGNFKPDELPSLPGTEKEVKDISKYFSAREVYSGKDMSAEILYKKGKDFDLLHLATHGILDKNSPLFSSLVFSDRRLNVYEIFDLDLKAYLVTLSACKTGFSEDANGDELVGLSRAFIYAGTPTICSSLWDVSDRATSELMKSFYFHLRDKNKTESLRLAQLDIMKKYHHPFFWAPFVLTGDWR
ncbi:MAG: CHAT domain-containing tetratricopeptide repeat protein [Candidatus Eremiobacterota bacterium]